MLKKVLSLKSDLFGNGIKVLILRIIGIFVFFSLSLYLTNNFPADLVGRYDFARSVLLIIGGITLLGTNQSIIYYSGFLKAKNSITAIRHIYFKMIAIIVAIAGVFLIGLWCLNESWINSFFDKRDAYSIILKVFFGLGIYAWSMLNIDMVRALGKTLLSEVLRNLIRYLPFLIIVVYIFNNNFLDFLIEAYVASFSVLWLLSLLFVIIQLKKFKRYIGEIHISFKEIVIKSYPMAISAMSYFMMQSVDIILLSKFDTYDNVAYYSIAVKLATTSSLALMSIGIVIAPRIAKIYTQEDYTTLKRLLKNSARFVFILSFIAISILVIFSSFILGLFGPMYTTATSALLILLSGQLFSAFAGPVGIYMNMTGKQNKLHKIIFIGLSSNIILNLVLIPRHGMEGAAIATAISMILWKLTAILYVLRKDKIKTFLS